MVSCQGIYGTRDSLARGGRRSRSDTHDSQNWWVSLKPDGSYQGKNYSPRCRGTEIPSTALVSTGYVEDITPINPDTPLEQALSICLNNMGFGDLPCVVAVRSLAFLLQPTLDVLRDQHRTQPDWTGLVFRPCPWNVSQARGLAKVPDTLEHDRPTWLCHGANSVCRAIARNKQPMS